MNHETKNLIMISLVSQFLPVRFLVFAFFLLLVFLFGPAPSVFAQEAVTDEEVVKTQDVEEPDKNNLITVESKPTGALVRISGVYSFVGRTPFVVPYPLQGRYEVKATKPGYETETSYVDFLSNEESSIVIRLTPKKRWKAGLRSIVFPGWGQFYSGQELRGLIFSAAEAALLVRTAFAINEYRDAKNELDRAVEVFESNLDEASFQDVQDALTTAKNDHNFQKTLVVIAAGFWAINVFDAIIFSASSHSGGNIELGTRPPLSYNYDGSKIMLTWKIGL